MLEQNQADSLSQASRRLLLANHSTGQLIPRCRAEALRAKREILRRKINRVADQIFSLKYDTEYEIQELKKLTTAGENLMQRAETNWMRVKHDIEDGVRLAILENDNLQENSDKMQEDKRELSDRSTLQSMMTEDPQKMCEFTKIDEELPSVGNINDQKRMMRASQPIRYKPKNQSVLYASLMVTPTKRSEQAYSMQIYQQGMRMQLVKQYPVGNILIFLGLLSVVMLMI